MIDAIIEKETKRNYEIYEIGFYFGYETITHAHNQGQNVEYITTSDIIEDAIQYAEEILSRKLNSAEISDLEEGLEDGMREAIDRIHLLS